MESKKMVPMNLFAGQKQRHRCREWNSGQSWGKERLGRTQTVALKHIHHHV